MCVCVCFVCILCVYDVYVRGPCRFGFSQDCLVVAGSGDNCNSLAGMGIVSAGEGAAAGGGGGAGGQERGGDVMVSLGTSDTLLGVTTDPSPTTTGIIICTSIDTQKGREGGGDGDGRGGGGGGGGNIPGNVLVFWIPCSAVRPAIDPVRPTIDRAFPREGTDQPFFPQDML